MKTTTQRASIESLTVAQELCKRFGRWQVRAYFHAVYQEWHKMSRAKTFAHYLGEQPSKGRVRLTTAEKRLMWKIVRLNQPI